MKTAKEILKNKLKEKQGKLSDIHWYSTIIEAMEVYAQQKWKEGCRLQIEACSDKVFELLNTDDDAETWHNKVLTTDIVEYEE